jgi:hypothetical protein
MWTNARDMFYTNILGEFFVLGEMKIDKTFFHGLLIEWKLLLFAVIKVEPTTNENLFSQLI